MPGGKILFRVLLEIVAELRIYKRMLSGLATLLVVLHPKEFQRNAVAIKFFGHPLHNLAFSGLTVESAFLEKARLPTLHPFSHLPAIANLLLWHV